MASTSVVSPDVLITIKLQLGAENRRFKLPLRDLGANTFPGKVCRQLQPRDAVIMTLSIIIIINNNNSNNNNNFDSLE